MIKLLGKLEVGPHTYRVCETDELKGLYGITDPETAVIHIASDLKPARWNETLLHEALHALLDMSGGSYAIQTAPRQQREELLVRAMTPHLLGMLASMKAHRR